MKARVWSYSCEMKDWFVYTDLWSRRLTPRSPATLSTVYYSVHAAQRRVTSDDVLRLHAAMETP